MPHTLTYYTFNEKIPDIGRTIQMYFVKGQHLLALSYTEGTFTKADYELEFGENDYPQPDYLIGEEEIFLSKHGEHKWIYTDDFYPIFGEDMFFPYDWQWYLDNGYATFEIDKELTGPTNHNRQIDFIDGYYKYAGKVWYISIVNNDEVFNFELINK